MATKSKRQVPAVAIHPGEILREELKERGLKQNEFAKLIGCPSSNLNEYIKGKRSFNSDFSMKLEEQLGIPYKYWMNMQSGYDYDCMAIEKRNEEIQEAMTYENDCKKILNLNYILKSFNMELLSCVERVKKLKVLFPFGLRSSSDLCSKVSGLYKHSEKVQIDEKNMLTWLVMNWFATSRSKLENKYQTGNAIKAAEEIAILANEQNLSEGKIKACLESYGIAYLVVQKLDKAPIDAFSTISNGHPSITVTYRYNDMDKLAFDVLHELCHIERHLTDDCKSFISVEGSVYSEDAREKEANEFARNMLIPENIWNDIMKIECKNLDPYKVVKTIAKEAEQRGISASIAVSRYKHDKAWYKTPSYKSPKIY